MFPKNRVNININLSRMTPTMSSAATASSDDPLQSRFIGMFSYGSNNEQQLRARVNSPNLRCVRLLNLNSVPCCAPSCATSCGHGKTPKKCTSASYSIVHITMAVKIRSQDDFMTAVISASKRVSYNVSFTITSRLLACCIYKYLEISILCARTDCRDYIPVVKATDSRNLSLSSWELEALLAVPHRGRKRHERPRPLVV